MEPKDSAEQSFEERFYSARQELANSIEQAVKEKRAQDGEFVAEVQRRLQELRLILREERLVIPKYELARARRALTDLEALIHSNVLKENKLAFSTVKFDQTQRKAVHEAGPKKSEETGLPTLTKHSLKTDDPAYLSERNDEEIILDNLKANDVVRLTKLLRCRVHLVCVVAAATFKELTDCTIICCPIASSIYVANCDRCTIVGACQQLRIHNSKDCSFYVHVTTCGTLENCSAIGMAPYEVSMTNKEQKFKQAGLNIQTNNWNDVKDFNHPFCGGQSPNWFIIDECRREKFNLG